MCVCVCLSHVCVCVCVCERERERERERKKERDKNHGMRYCIIHYYIHVHVIINHTYIVITARQLPGVFFVCIEWSKRECTKTMFIASSVHCCALCSMSITVVANPCTIITVR